MKPSFTFFGIVHIWAGSVVLRSNKVDGLGKYFTGGVFILWGIHKIDFPYLRNITAFAPWGYLIGGYCAMMLATGLLLIYFQRTRNALTESERKYRSLVTNIPDIAWRADSNGKDKKGSWKKIEIYIHKHTNAKFSHSICPECAQKLYPEIYDNGFAETEPGCEA